MPCSIEFYNAVTLSSLLSSQTEPELHMPCNEYDLLLSLRLISLVLA